MIIIVHVNVDMNCVTEHVPSIHWLSFLVLSLGLYMSCSEPGNVEFYKVS